MCHKITLIHMMIHYLSTQLYTQNWVNIIWLFTYTYYVLSFVPLDFLLFYYNEISR